MYIYIQSICQLQSLLVARFLLRSALRGLSAMEELLVLFYMCEWHYSDIVFDSQT